MRRLTPLTPGTKKANLKATITNLASKRAEEMERHLLNIEEFMKRYEVFAGRPRDEYFANIVIFDPCAKNVEDRLELATKDMSYSEVMEKSGFSSRDGVTPLAVLVPWTWTTRSPVIRTHVQALVRCPDDSVEEEDWQEVGSPEISQMQSYGGERKRIRWRGRRPRLWEILPGIEGMKEGMARRKGKGKAKGKG